MPAFLRTSSQVSLSGPQPFLNKILLTIISVTQTVILVDYVEWFLTVVILLKL